MWTQIPEPELPEDVPDVRELMPPVPGVPREWFAGASLADPDVDRDVYALRVGNGGAIPYQILVVTVARELGPEDPAPATWPTFPELWEIADELAREGAILTFPAYVAGADRGDAMADDAGASFVLMTQIGAMPGSAAGARMELGGARILRPGVGKP